MLRAGTLPSSASTSSKACVSMSNLPGGPTGSGCTELESSGRVTLVSLDEWEAAGDAGSGGLISTMPPHFGHAMI
jgi:hypothetical protein